MDRQYMGPVLLWPWGGWSYPKQHLHHLAVLVCIIWAHVWVGFGAERAHQRIAIPAPVNAQGGMPVYSPGRLTVV